MANGQKEVKKKEADDSRPEPGCMRMVAAAVYYRDEIARAVAERQNATILRVPGEDEKRKPRKMDISSEAVGRMLRSQEYQREQLAVHPPAADDLNRIMNSNVGKTEQLVPGASFNMVPYTGRATASMEGIVNDWKVLGSNNVGDVLGRELNSLLKAINPRVKAIVGGWHDDTLRIVDTDTGTGVEMKLPPESTVYITRNQADKSVSVITMLRGENDVEYSITRFFRTPGGLETSIVQLQVDKSPMDAGKSMQPGYRWTVQ